MKTRLYAAGVIGGVAALAMTLVVVFAFGRHNPSPPLLKDNPRPEIPGRILYTDRDGCFIVAQASGAGEERLACSQQFGPIGQEFWWDGADTVRWVYRVGPNDGRIYQTNIRTGEQKDTGETYNAPEFPLKPGFPGGPDVFGCIEGPDGTGACVNKDGDLVMVRDGANNEVASFDLPEYNIPNVKAWSPDSQWVVLEYYPRRAQGPELWIVKRDGSVRATLVKDNTTFTRVAWQIEGVGVWPTEPD